LPWFLPLFVFGLLGWVCYEPIEKYAIRKNTQFWTKAMIALRWLPPAQLLLMLFIRIISLIQR